MLWYYHIELLNCFHEFSDSSAYFKRRVWCFTELRVKFLMNTKGRYSHNSPEFHPSHRSSVE